MTLRSFADASAPRAVLLAAQTGDESWTPAESLAELARLAETAGIEVVESVVQQVRDPQTASYLGRGKIRELKENKSTLRFDTIIADDELTPTQQRYLDDVLDVQVLDRTALILHIFAMHARTREGRLQVELAQYRYRLPRLAGYGRELSRLGGGINTRGPGETKLESDRRRIRRRIADLNRELEDVRRIRALHRRQRRTAGIPVVALVGYTNAGKSTLMNALTGATVLSSDQLFATLDPTTRRLALPNGHEVLLTDTVGFIQKLPSVLVAAFRATLEEVAEADLIVHVIDVSHPQMEEQAEAVEDELESLEVADKPRIAVLNKIDLVPVERLPIIERRFTDPVAVSALTGHSLATLQARLAELVGREYIEVRVQIPYTEAALIGLFRTRGLVEHEDHRAAGTVIEGRLPAGLLPNFQPFISR